MFYADVMSRIPPQPAERAMLSLRIGQWFEANANGWGVLCVPIVVLLLLAATVVVQLGWGAFG